MRSAMQRNVASKFTAAIFRFALSRAPIAIPIGGWEGRRQSLASERGPRRGVWLLGDRSSSTRSAPRSSRAGY